MDSDKTHIPGCDCDECVCSLGTFDSSHSNVCTCNECVVAALASADETMMKTELAFDFVQAIFAIEKAFKGDLEEAQKSIKSVSRRYLYELSIAGENIKNMADAEIVSRSQVTKVAA